MRTSTAVWIAAAALAGCTMQAETFHNQNWILFKGTIRMAVSEPAVSNVLEESHIEAKYQELRANHGRPLHLSRIAVSVRNGSGRELDFLRADSWVRSELPPCTNWVGPEALPEPFGALRWEDHLEVLSLPDGMHAGQEEGPVVYVLPIDGQRPQFGERDINYTFAE